VESRAVSDGERQFQVKQSLHRLLAGPAVLALGVGLGAIAPGPVQAWAAPSRTGSRCRPFTYPDGSYPSNRRQPFDAAFGLETVPQTCLHKEVLVGKGGNPAPG